MRQKTGSEDKAEPKGSDFDRSGVPAPHSGKGEGAQQQSRVRARLPNGILALKVTRCY
jgi:hypothetical protein